MQVRYYVNRVSVGKAPATVTVGGEPTIQDIDRLSVELTDPTGTHGSVEFRFTKPSDMAWARQAFVSGKSVYVEISPLAIADPAG